LRFLHFEFLNALQTGLAGSRLAAFLVEVRAQTSNDGVLNLEDSFLLHRLTKELCLSFFFFFFNLFPVV